MLLKVSKYMQPFCAYFWRQCTQGPCCFIIPSFVSVPPREGKGESGYERELYSFCIFVVGWSDAACILMLNTGSQDVVSLFQITLACVKLT